MCLSQSLNLHPTFLNKHDGMMSDSEDGQDGLCHDLMSSSHPQLHSQDRLCHACAEAHSGYRTFTGLRGSIDLIKAAISAVPAAQLSGTDTSAM